MNVLVSSSRGGGLERRLKSRRVSFRIKVQPGGRILKLTDEALKLLPPPSRHNHTHTHHVYILAGIPDITEKYTSDDSTYRYTECIYTEDPDKTITRIKQYLDTASKKILNAGAIPCFCTIPATNIHKYNTTLMEDRKTHYWHHAEYYDEMQDRLHKVLDTLNTHIIHLNNHQNMSTPMLHSAIKVRKGKAPRGYYKYEWEGLKDGVHGTEPTKDKWATSLQVAINKNRQRHNTPSDEETHSPKRSWRLEKNPKRQRNF